MEMNWINATRLSICYRNHHLHRPDIDITDMDDIRKSFSKLKRDFKHRVGGKKRGPDRAGANSAGEGVGSPASPLRSGPRVEDGRISADVSQAYSRDPSPRLEPVTADEDRLDDSQRKEVGVDEKEVSRSHSYLDPDVENTGGSGSNRSCPNRNLTVRGHFLLNRCV